MTAPTLEGPGTDTASGAPGAPLGATQQSIWAAYRFAPDSAVYNITMPLRVRGPLDVPALARAVTETGRRQAQLRSYFTERDGVPVRVEKDAPYVALDVRQVPGVPEEELRRLAREAGEQPFDLTEAVFRVVLLQRAEDDFALVMALHHIVGDFTSRTLLARDLLDAYRGITAGGEPAWRPLKGSFADAVAEEEEYLASGPGERAAAYWRETTEGVPAAELPLDRPRPPRPGYRGATVAVELPAELTERLAEVAKAAGTTPFAVHLGAFQALVARWTGQEDFLVGVPASSRLGRGARDLVGCYLNTLAVRARLAPGTTFEEAAQEAGRQVQGAMFHARHPCTLIARPPGAPLFRIGAFLVQMHRMDPPVPTVPRGSAEGPALEYGDLSLALIDVPQQEGQLDLMLRLEQEPQGTTAVFSYDTDLFEPETADRFARTYERFLRTAVDRPAAGVTDVPLTDEDELAALLALGDWEGSW
ncbi:condensation domain-containing protein [Streptomyces sp. NPDC101118]|uniref:condensation domain-containing protein n=1 Tax=Streptomyces sp. NPDC101118 TaxID=3366109 RepID=UPI0037FDC268